MTPLYACVQIRIKASTSGKVIQKAPFCPAPAPTPAGGAGYTLYGRNERTASGTFVGYTGTVRRALAEGKVNARASACQALCSGAGYTPVFYFSVETTGSRACYCSQDKCVTVCYEWAGRRECCL